MEPAAFSPDSADSARPSIRSTAAPTLGRFEQVPLRDIWTSESGDFTPWLAGAENLKLLGEALGLELEPQDIEAAVGPYRADIVCRDPATNTNVLIENQLEL